MKLSRKNDWCFLYSEAPFTKISCPTTGIPKVGDPSQSDAQSSVWKHWNEVNDLVLKEDGYGNLCESAFRLSCLCSLLVLTVDQAYEAIDLPILVLLFGTMVVSGYLERADAFKYLVSSALFTNDTSCMVLTEFVLKIARQNNLPPEPFLLALASSANIGSTATPIGNPQNLVIATQGRVSFGEFITGILPATILGVLFNALLLMFVYGNKLSVKKDQEDLTAGFVNGKCVDSHHFSPATMTVGSSVHHETLEHRANSDPDNHWFLNGAYWDYSNQPCSQRWKKKLWKSCVYLVVVGMLISLLMGLNMSGTALTAALALVILDFKDAVPCLEKVSYSLLLFFCGMFVTVQGFNQTGIPSALWELMEPYAKIDEMSGLAVLALVILVLSNLVSNVPTVLLLGARMAASAALISPAFEKKAWLILAWVSTVAGNLSLLGSAANLIVCEQACRVPHLGYTLTFWNHLKFGVPSTLLVTAMGLILLKS
ncbi:hypothetical protein V6N11_015032 [Hibiscus sabdariffa]|uniref:Citrate transporter-like domain-containing protein n=1 Tax=Hibiscus sabdariffa TaxID=183260 RepID=A0ABR2TR15_9ROSI